MYQNGLWKMSFWRQQKTTGFTRLAHCSVEKLEGIGDTMALRSMPLKSDCFHPFLTLCFLLLAVPPISLLAMSIPIVGWLVRFLQWFRWFSTKLSKNDSIELFCKENSSVVQQNPWTEKRPTGFTVGDFVWSSMAFPSRTIHWCVKFTLQRSCGISLSIMTTQSVIQRQEKDKPVRKKRKLLLS